MKHQLDENAKSPDNNKDIGLLFDTICICTVIFLYLNIYRTFLCTLQMTEIDMRR